MGREARRVPFPVLVKAGTKERFQAGFTEASVQHNWVLEHSECAFDGLFINMVAHGDSCSKLDRFSEVQEPTDGFAYTYFGLIKGYVHGCSSSLRADRIPMGVLR